MLCLSGFELYSRWVALCRIIVSIENTYIRLFILHFYDCFKVSLDLPPSIYCFKVQACFSQSSFTSLKPILSKLGISSVVAGNKRSPKP